MIISHLTALRICVTAEDSCPVGHFTMLLGGQLPMFGGKSPCGILPGLLDARVTSQKTSNCQLFTCYAASGNISNGNMNS